jgi:hypothetical protein
MAGRRAERPGPVTVAQTPGVDDPKTQRAIDVLTGAVQELQGRGIVALSVTGSRASGDALESLLARLAELGFIVDDTTP